MSGAEHRVDAQPAFVLHSQPYRETSLLFEVFSRDHGRVALMARGARRPRSALRGVLTAFQPLELAWFGQGEVKTLAKAEWQQALPMLSARTLLLGYYLNELLLRLLAREDSHPQLFLLYADVMRQLRLRHDHDALLRGFELAMLRELGYGPTLDRDADSGVPVSEEGVYVYLPERGISLAQDDLIENGYRGKDLLAISRGDFSSASVRRAARRLMRELLATHLGDRELQSRRVFMDMQEL